MEVVRRSGRVVVIPDRNDLCEAFLIAWTRNESKMRKGVRTRKMLRGRDDLTTHVIGVLAELAVAHVLDATVDLQLLLAGDKHAPDHQLPNGQTVETKYRAERGWDFALTTNRMNDFRSDYGVLVWPAEGRSANAFDLDMEIVGYIAFGDFYIHAVERDYKYGPRLVVSADQLKPIDQLIDKVRVTA